MKRWFPLMVLSLVGLIVLFGSLRTPKVADRRMVEDIRPLKPYEYRGKVAIRTRPEVVDELRETLGRIRYPKAGASVTDFASRSSPQARETMAELLRDVVDRHRAAGLDEKIQGLKDSRTGLFLAEDREHQERIRRFNAGVYESSDSFKGLIHALLQSDDDSVRIAAQYINSVDALVAGSFDPWRFFGDGLADELVALAHGSMEDRLRDVLADALSAVGHFRRVKSEAGRPPFMTEDSVKGLAALSFAEPDPHRRLKYSMALIGLPDRFPEVKASLALAALDESAPEEVRQVSASALALAQVSDPFQLETAIAMLDDRSTAVQLIGSKFFGRQSATDEEKILRDAYFASMYNKLIDTHSSSLLRDSIASRLGESDHPGYGLGGLDAVIMGTVLSDEGSWNVVETFRFHLQAAVEPGEGEYEPFPATRRQVTDRLSLIAGDVGRSVELRKVALGALAVVSVYETSKGDADQGKSLRAWIGPVASSIGVSWEELLDATPRVYKD